jgi:hypothetical protein
MQVACFGVSIGCWGTAVAKGELGKGCEVKEGGWTKQNLLLG